MGSQEVIQIPKDKIKFSQFCINPVFTNSGVTVSAWFNRPPYNVPIEIVKLENGDYLSFDNRRLYSSKKHNTNSYISCILCNKIPEYRIESDSNIFTVYWESQSENHKILHKLTLKALTMEALCIIRCASQSTSFPLTGTFDEPLLGDRKELSKYCEQVKLNPYKKFETSTDDFHTSFQNASKIYIRMDNHVNLAHPRNDLRDYILNHQELFELDDYGKSSTIQLKARGDKSDDQWDDWDKLYMAVCENQDEMEEYYCNELMKNLKLYCNVPTYTLRNDGTAEDILKLEKSIVEKYKPKLIEQFSLNCKDIFFIDCAVGASIDFFVFGNSPHCKVENTLEIDGYIFDLKTVYESSSVECDLKNGQISVNKDQINITYSDQLKERLKWSTKQCFGYTSIGDRCKNRRFGDNHVWCHFHEYQSAFYNKSSPNFSPDWW